MKSESISLKKAQTMILKSQKLTGPALTPLETLEQLGYVQIDTISVVERAHHHVFWTRNNKYSPKDLDKLVKDRKAFEYWSHAASYLPMKEYRFSLPIKKAHQKNAKPWYPRDKKLMSAVLRRIKNEGPLRSKDFENTRKGNTGWWDFKPAKRALEGLFFEGKLEISRREGFQKVYDLPERVVPSKIDTSMPSDSEYFQYLIRRTLRHHGLASVNEIAYLCKKSAKLKVAKELNDMIENGDVVKVEVENNSEVYFATKEALSNSDKYSPKLFILSPFDNFVIQRKKLSTFFNYDYQIECYVPEAKRKYGYFSLPIFNGREGVARIDCKVDRKNKELLINSMHYEKGVDKKSLDSKLAPKLKAFAKFNGCEL